MPGGRITKEKLKFIVDSIDKYAIDRVHFTTCQTVQLHNLNESTVCSLSLIHILLMGDDVRSLLASFEESQEEEAKEGDESLGDDGDKDGLFGIKQDMP